MREDKAVQYMRLARSMAAELSKDPSTKVGAILLAPDSLQVLSLGYNGMPRGIDETQAERWERPTKYLYVEHAERNCLYNACRHGTPVEGSTCVVTLFPCVDCCRALIQSGVKMVVTVEPDFDDARWGEQWTFSRDLLLEAKVETIMLKESDLISVTE